jgi:hypothetical protein
VQSPCVDPWVNSAINSKLSVLSPKLSVLNPKLVAEGKHQATLWLIPISLNTVRFGRSARASENFTPGHKAVHTSVDTPTIDSEHWAFYSEHSALNSERKTLYSEHSALYSEH